MFPRLPAVYRTLCVVLILGILFFTLLIPRSYKSTDKNIILPSSSKEWTLKGGIREINRPPDSFTTNKVKLQLRTILPDRSSNVPSLSAVIKTTTLPPIVNPHDFGYILNPSTLCVDQYIYMIVYIHTAPKNFRKRQTIRQTWGNQKILTKYNSKMIFVMGQVTDRLVMDKVRMESQHYGDIVQENFLDTYRNLTYKGIAALKWISNHCSNATYALKTDDDIIVNFFQLMNVFKRDIEKRYGKNSLILCNQWTRMKVLRDKKSKWYIPPEVFPRDYFPPYCSGSAFVFSIDVVKKMNDVSSYVPFFWVDDYYVTGMLAEKIGVKQKRLNEAYILNGKIVVDRCKNDTENKLLFFHVSKLNSIYSMWAMIKARMNIPDENFSWKAIS